MSDSPRAYLAQLEPMADGATKEVRLFAFGEHDLRNQVWSFHPGFRLRSFRPDTDVHEDCGYAWDAHDNRVFLNKLPFGCPTEAAARAQWGDR